MTRTPAAPDRPLRRVRSLIALVASAAALVPVVAPGCSATDGGGRSLVRVEAPAWVDLPAVDWDPAAQPCAFFATGRTPPERSTAATEARARDAALARVSAFADAAITRFDQCFATQAGGVVEPAALAALRSEPALRRQLGDGALGATSVQGQWADDDKFCVWVRLDAQTGLLAPYEQALARKLASQARELSPADHARLLAELTRFVAERNSAR